MKMIKLKVNTFCCRGVVQYLVPWVTNSCPINPLAERLVLVTPYMISRCFSKAIIGKHIKEHNVPTFTAKDIWNYT